MACLGKSAYNFIFIFIQAMDIIVVKYAAPTAAIGVRNLNLIPIAKRMASTTKNLPQGNYDAVIFDSSPERLDPLLHDEKLDILWKFEERYDFAEGELVCFVLKCIGEAHSVGVRITKGLV
jgi:hypothetical protein